MNGSRLPYLGQRELIWDLGLTPKIPWRIAEVAVLDAHTKGSLMEILKGPHGSPWEDFRHLTEGKIPVHASASDLLAEVALRRGLGARFLTAACRTVARELVFLREEEMPTIIDGAWLERWIVPRLMAA